MHGVAAIVHAHDENVTIGEHLRRESEIQIDRRQNDKVESFKHDIVNTSQCVAYNGFRTKEPLGYKANALEHCDGGQADDKA